ncbi:MAG: 3-phosphoshikimate 1-carboxyvinyltransferase [Oligoflexales bacterium]
MSDFFQCQTFHNIDTHVNIPGSKSLTNRSLLIAALATGTSKLHNALICDDSIAMLNLLQQIGIFFEQKGTQISIMGCQGSFQPTKKILYGHASGTVVRFLATALHLGQGVYTLTGDPSISSRPLAPLLQTLRKSGLKVEELSQYSLPIKIYAKGFPGGDLSIETALSSQFLSSLMIAGAYAKKPLNLKSSTELPSEGYIRLTSDVMKAFGCIVENNKNNKTWLVPNSGYTGTVYNIEGDASSASYFFSIAVLTESSIHTTGISTQSAQPDIQGLEVLKSMGASVKATDSGLYVQAPHDNTLRGVDCDMNTMTDIVPTLAVTALFATTRSRFRNVEHMRYKECDRLHALITEISRAGGSAYMEKSDLIVEPCATFTPCTFQTYNDHRMAMALSLIGCRVPGFSIQNPSVVDKTFPGYFKILNRFHSLYLKQISQ